MELWKKVVYITRKVRVSSFFSHNQNRESSQNGETCLHYAAFKNYDLNCFPKKHSLLSWGSCSRQRFLLKKAVCEFNEHTEWYMVTWDEVNEKVKSKRRSLTQLSCAYGMSGARGSSRSCAWRGPNQAERQPMSLQSGQVCHTGHAQWSNSTSIHHRNKCCWLQERESHDSRVYVTCQVHSNIQYSTCSEMKAGE